MKREPVRELLGQPVAQFVVDASKRSPRHLFFYRPTMVRLPALERIGPHGPVRVERAIKLLPVLEKAFRRRKRPVCAMWSCPRTSTQGRARLLLDAWTRPAGRTATST